MAHQTVIERLHQGVLASLVSRNIVRGPGGSRDQPHGGNRVPRQGLHLLDESS